MGLFDPELRLALWNERFFELLAFGPELRRRGMHGSELLRAAAERGYLGAGDPAAIVGELMNSALTNPRRQLEFRLPDGRVIGALRVTVPDGRSVLTLEDITERHEVGLMKDQFVSTVSHELRTPLTSIRGALALFKHGHGDRLDERGRRLIGMALSNSERLSTLIDDILDIEKLSARAVEHRVEETDLRDLTAEAVERNRPLGFASDVELDFHPGSEPLPLFGDPVRLQQAVTNLLSNAVKHSPKDGTVEVTTERNGEFARLRVADQGAGIPVEFRPKLFQRFSQAPSTRQRGTGGTGLGLAITRTIVERHGGTIAFECPADGGTLFWFDIPIAEPRS
jgi:signal transduction histidine kinase